MKGRSNTSVPVFHGALRAVQIVHLPSVSHTAKDGDSRLIFQIGKPQRNVSDDPRNTPCSCQSVSAVLLLLSVLSFLNSSHPLFKKKGRKKKSGKDVMKHHNGCGIYHRATAVIGSLKSFVYSNNSSLCER